MVFTTPPTLFLFMNCIVLCSRVIYGVAVKNMGIIGNSLRWQIYSRSWVNGGYQGCLYFPKLIEWYTENVSMLLHVNSSWYLVMSRLYPTVNFWLDILGTCTSRKFHQRRFCIIKFENCLCFLKMSWCLGSYDCLFCFVLDCSEYTKNVHASSRQSSAIMSSAFSSSWVNVGPTLLWSLLCVQNYGTFIDIS